MSRITQGRRQTFSIADGGVLVATSNGGLATITIAPTTGTVQTVSLGPLPTRRTFGPFAEGAVLTVDNQTADLEIEGSISPARLIAEPFATTWDATAQKDLGEFQIAGPLALTSASQGVIPGGQSQAVLISDGTNVPTVDGFPLAPFDTTAGALTLVTLAYVAGSVRWFSAAILNTTVPSIVYDRFDVLSQMVESGNASTSWVYTSSGTGWAPNVAMTTRGLTGDGYFELQRVVGSVMFVIDAIAGNTTYQQPTANGVFIEPTVNGDFNGVIGGGGGVGNLQNTVAFAAGDTLRATRVGSNLTFAVARGATPTTWVPIHTFSGVTGKVHPRVHSNTATSAIHKLRSSGMS